MHANMVEYDCNSSKGCAVESGLGFFFSAIERVGRPRDVLSWLGPSDSVGGRLPTLSTVLWVRRLLRRMILR